MTQEVAIVVLRDTDGDFFLHQRRSDKEMFPSLWGVGAGGKIDPGEPAEDAAIRELWEEAGCIPHLRHCFDMTYESDAVVTEMHVFEATVKREDVGFDDSEWEMSRWCPEEELRALAMNDLTLCPDTVAFVRRYLGLVSTASHGSHR